MTTTESFDRRLEAWLDQDAHGRVPDHLDEVLLATRATAQRPGWLSLERWFPVSTIVRERIALPGPMVGLGVLALLILGLLGAILLATGRPGPLTYVPASNGRIVFVDGGSIVTAASDGSDPRSIAGVPEGSSGLVVSPDGRHAAYLAPSSQGLGIVRLVDAAGAATPIAVTAPGMEARGVATWSPTGDRIVFVAGDGEGDHLFAAGADGSSVQEIGAGAIDLAWIAWPTWSPDGSSIAFIGDVRDSQFGSAFLIHPDGMGLQELQGAGSLDAGVAGSLAWSPDPAVQRLLYVESGNRVAMFDVAANAKFTVSDGFWPVWSPSGDRIAYWNDGTKVMAVTDALAQNGHSINVFAPFAENCPVHPELAGKAFCGPAAWSPDGTRLIAPDITGDVLLSLLADGTGDPIVIDVSGADPLSRVVDWQPIRR